MKIRIVIADDHQIVREGLAMLLERAGYELVGAAADGMETLRLCEEMKPDVAVLDLSMPLLSGCDCAREIRRASPRTLTILLTMHDQDRYLADAIRAGVSAYVLKSGPADDLLKAIEAVLRGEVFMRSSVSEEAVREALESDRPNNTLTTRERQVLNLVVDGKATKEIASALGISVKTAESHRVRIMKKLDTHNTAGLVRYAIREGLVLVEPAPTTT